MLAGQGFISAGGARLEYIHAGPSPAQASCIVLLHEGLGSAALWGKFPELLSDATGMGVFAYSREGYGASSPCALPRPLTYMHDEAKSVLGPVLDHIGFREGFLLGHSDGASIAAIYGGSVDDERIRGISLMAPHFFVEDISIAAIELSREAYRSGDLRQKLARWHTNVDCAFNGWNGAWLDPGFRNWDISASLKSVFVPLQIIQGAEDQYGTLQQIEVARACCSSPPDVLILPGVKHSPYREAPGDVVKAVSRFFLTSLTGGFQHSSS